MAECDECGKNEQMPYECKRCGGTFCVEHRLPESHDCPGLNAWSGSEGTGTLGGSGPSTSGGLAGKNPRQSSGGLTETLPFDTGQSGLAGYYRNNMTFVFLLAMWLTFGAQLLLGVAGFAGLSQELFLLRTWAIGDVWTWVTSIFAHGGFFHIVLNSLVLYFFGPPVERKLGSKRFTILFLATGVVAGLGQVGFSLFLGNPAAALGASGAILGIMGVLTVLDPNIRVMLLFPPIPMPLWVLTTGYAMLSVVLILGAGPGAGGIGHVAHLLGLVIGLAYGEKLKREGVSPPGRIQMGGGPGGPGGGLGGRRRF